MFVSIWRTWEEQYSSGNEPIWQPYLGFWNPLSAKGTKDPWRNG